MPLTNSSPSPSLHPPSPGKVFALLGESAAHRAELAEVELAEARDHAARSLLFALGATFLGMLAAGIVALLLASIVWASPYRVWWLAGFAAASVIGTGAFAFALRTRLKAWRPLDETRFQLQEDFSCLRTLWRNLEQ